jgi:hypothetical protein
MSLAISEPIVIIESGKYWISIYGVYEEIYNSAKRFDIASTTKNIGAKMCRWDPTGLLGDAHYYPDWGTAMIDNPLYYGLSFAISGTLEYPDKTLYNIYLDDDLVATDVEKTTYQYPKQIIISEDHHWCVTTRCPSYIESEKICQQTQGLIYDINVSANPSYGGTVAGEGVYGHGINVTVTATPNDEYVFVSWTNKDTVISTDASFTFKAIENLSLVANFRKAQFLPFDQYAVTKWNNTFMLNLKKLAEDNYNVTTCIWFKNGVRIGEGFAYSAGSQKTDLLEAGAKYNFELYTHNSDTLISTYKIIGSHYNSGLKVYPNPLPQGNILTIEGCTQNDMIEVYNSNGACIARTIALGNVMELPLAVPAGIYIVRVNKKEVKVLIK